MHRFDRRIDFLQSAGDIHQATRFADDDDLRAACVNAFDFLLHHRARNFRIDDAKDAAKAAASFLRRKRHEFQSFDRAQKLFGFLTNAQTAQAVARRVIRDLVRERRADIGHFQHVDQKLAKLEGARGGVLRERMFGRAGWENLGVAMAHEIDARAGRRDDVAIGLAKCLEPLPRNADGLALQAAVVKRLTATRLLVRHLALHAESFQNLDHVFQHRRIKVFAEAG